MGIELRAPEKRELFIAISLSEVNSRNAASDVSAMHTCEAIPLNWNGEGYTPLRINTSVQRRHKWLI